MKWGVRRYQNPDGTRTPEGKKRYSKVKAGIKNFKEKATKKEREIQTKYVKLQKKVLDKLVKDVDNSPFDDETKEYIKAIKDVDVDKAIALIENDNSWFDMMRRNRRMRQMRMMR